MHSSEFLMELVADSYYRKFLAYGIGGESVHDYLQILFYRADAVRHSESTVLSPVFRVEYMA